MSTLLRSRLLPTCLVTAATDAVFSSTLAVAAYGSTVSRLWQGVASVVLGPSALTGGARTVVIIPTLTGRPPAINARWWVQLVGHIPFVALPIVAMSARGVRNGVAGRMAGSMAGDMVW